MTAGGNDQQIAKSKNVLKSVVIGVVVISSAWLIMSFVLSAFESDAPKATDAAVTTRETSDK